MLARHLGARPGSAAWTAASKELREVLGALGLDRDEGPGASPGQVRIPRQEH